MTVTVRDDPDPRGSGSSASGPTWRSGRTYRRLFLARLLSQGADGAFTICLAGFVLFSPEKAPDATALALDLAAVLLPYSLLGPFSGIVLDRIRRRDLLLVGGLSRAGLAVVVATLLSLGSQDAVIVVAVIVLAVSRFVLSALSAALPMTVPAADLVAAGSLTTTSGTAASIVGGGLAALVRLVAGSSPGGLAAVALAAAGVYAAAGLAAMLAARTDFGPLHPRPWTALGSEARAVIVDAADGARYLWSRRPARAALIAVNGSRLCYGFVFVTLLLVLKRVGGVQNADAGLASIGAVGTGLVIGTLAAAVVTPRWVRRTSRSSVISAALFLVGLVVAVLCPWLSSALFIVTSVGIGFATQAAKICSDALVQTNVDDEHRGRAFAFVDMTFNVSYVTAAAVAAVVLPEDARSRVGLLTAGLLWSAVGLCYGISARRSMTT